MMSSLDSKISVLRNDNVPKISVVMSTYNSLAYVDKAVSSVQSQTLGDWELIIVDDASVDHTDKRLHELAKQDTRIDVFCLDTNMGPGYARNIAIGHAHGEWVAMLDSDDWWEEDRLAKLLQYAESRYLDVVLDDIYLHDHDRDKRIGTRKWSEVSPDIKKYLGGGATLSDVCGTSLSSLHPMVRQGFLKRTKVIYPEVRRSEDFGFLLELAWFGANIGVYPGAKYHYLMRDSGKGLAMYYGIYKSRQHYMRLLKSPKKEYFSDPEMLKAVQFLRKHSRSGYRMFVMRKLLNVLIPSSRFRAMLLDVYHRMAGI